MEIQILLEKDNKMTKLVNPIKTDVIPRVSDHIILEEVLPDDLDFDYYEVTGVTHVYHNCCSEMYTVHDVVVKGCYAYDLIN